MKKAVTAGIILAVVAAVLICIYTGNQPTYRVEGNLLHSETNTYISAKDELHLAAIKVGDRVGWTDQRDPVKAIVDESSDRYLYVVGDMMESVYRNQNQEPITLEQIQVSQISIANGTKAITDQAEIEAFLKPIREKSRHAEPSVLENNTVSVKEIWLHSTEHPGLAFRLLVHLTRDHKAYISDTISSFLIEAEPKSLTWMTEK